MPEINEEVVDSPEVVEGEEVAEPSTDVETLQKKLETLKATVGSTKRELKDAKKALEDAKKALNPETPQKTQQSNEPDYARLAFLNSQQVTHPDDQKLVIDEAARLKLPLTDVLQMEHIKGKLQTNNSQRVAQAGMPKGSGRSGGPNKSEVDYYLEHPDETPTDLELHGKVIAAKMKREENANKFSDIPFVG